MPINTELSNTPSRIFGEKFPYPLDGKSVLFEIASQFAIEFNQAAKLRLIEDQGSDRLAQWIDLRVTTAYPTSPQQCPRITVQRTGMQPRYAGLGGEISVAQTADGEGYRHFRGQMVTDNIDVSICTMNELLRDDLFIWFQQYVMDAYLWLRGQGLNVYTLQCVNAVDDQVEYQGSQSQPGFEFYAARMSFQVGYELVVLNNVDKLASIINWQSVIYANEL